MKINIKGAIISNDEAWIYEWFGIDHTTPKMVSDAIQDLSDEDIIVEINSPGGSVFDASEIYTALMSHKGNVEVHIVGLAASAASIIAMAGDNVLMSPTAQMMIHNASSIQMGDHRDMKHTADFLKGIDRTISNAYAKKTGLSNEKLLDMMSKETWLTPNQAKEHGFIDAVMFENEAPKVVANLNDLATGLLPQRVIDKLRNEMPNMLKVTNQSEPQPKPNNETEEDEIMNLEDLKNNHPDVYQQILNLGIAEGVKNENERIKNIDSLKKPAGIKNEEFQQIMNDAKADVNANAGEVAMKILNQAAEADATNRQNYLDNRQQDANPINQVKGTHGGDGAQGDGDEVKQAANKIAEKFGKKGGK
ncbi:head maturation protease, ClpP-related [Exiguobacterium sp. USCH10]|uniref:head maturation protease, ClpP-related n=1 Tax=Exiguobacterium sp. USCH10 TaxID=3024839 RepID=UPI0030983EAA